MLKDLKAAPILSTRIDVKKIDRNATNLWISAKLTELLGTEDEILEGMVQNSLDGTKELDPKTMIIELHTFLSDQSEVFVTELWTFLVNQNKLSKMKGKAAGFAVPIKAAPAPPQTAPQGRPRARCPR